jgi:hypothetical protein
LKSNPHNENTAEALHEKAQQAFKKYVTSQISIRKQFHNIELLLALNKNDADFILGMFFFFTF